MPVSSAISNGNLHVSGATGAFVYTVLAGLVLQLLIPRPAVQASADVAPARR